MSTEIPEPSEVSFGPVELNVILFEGSGPSPAVLHALAAQIRGGTVRLLDFVVVVKSASGAIEIREIDPVEFGLAELHLHAPGLSAEEDIEALAERVPSGGAAAIVAFELVWARELAERLAADGSVVVATERIPAPAVNAAVELALES
ncbi:hypothetical protein J4H92_11305 [Leucobacter weissii]|uniref:DUF1269 domain-containing family protein n=1 Tax=Leucobacter weissii TaxID=1983706 RepID=A0A939SCN3_9MICO|nr:DUF6325 family protein [Leucobacter weissii]MBO1902533.1 hypothetical protein [Leucobacter weissii]